MVSLCGSATEFVKPLVKRRDSWSLSITNKGRPSGRLFIFLHRLSNQHAPRGDPLGMRTGHTPPRRQSVAVTAGYSLETRREKPANGSRVSDKSVRRSRRLYPDRRAVASTYWRARPVDEPRVLCVLAWCAKLASRPWHVNASSSSTAVHRWN